MQAHLIALVDGETPPSMTPEHRIWCLHRQALQRLAGRRDPSDVLSRGQTALSAQPPIPGSETCSCCRGGNSGNSHSYYSGGEGRGTAPNQVCPRGQRQLQSHKQRVARGVPPTRRVPEYQLHAAVRGAVRAVPRAVHSPAVQLLEPACEALAFNTLAPAGGYRAPQAPSPERETAGSTRRPVQGALGRNGSTSGGTTRSKRPWSFSWSSRRATRSATICGT
jgi:hypothetical protein